MNEPEHAAVISQPVLRTARLELRPFAMADAPEVQHLAGDPEVSATALNIPYPFEDGMAEAWIESHRAGFAEGTLSIFAITSSATRELCGAVGLQIEPEHERAELGYWLGKAHWGHGFATEAAAAVMRYGFEALGLRRIHGNHQARNSSSGRVLQKIGMSYEGCLRQHVVHRNVPEDLVLYGIMRTEFFASIGS